MSSIPWPVDTYMLQNHEVVDEENTFAFEQLPYCLSAPSFRFLKIGNLPLSVWVGYQVWPVSILRDSNQITFS